MKRPHVTLKFAQTLDGRIAARDGSSRWISSIPSRRFAHKLRAESDAVLVGIRTVLADNPSLTTRLVKGRNPARVIIDGKLRIPTGSKVLGGTKRARTIIVTTPRASKKKIRKLKNKGVEFIVLSPRRDGNIDLEKIIRILYTKRIRSVLVEGGAKIITSFLKSGLADRLIAIVSPRIIGKGVDAVGDLGIGNIKKSLKLRLKSVKRLGKDIALEFGINR